VNQLPYLQLTVPTATKDAEVLTQANVPQLMLPTGEAAKITNQGYKDSYNLH
jgi:hypothetical protein